METQPGLGVQDPELPIVATNVLCDFQETPSPLWASLGSPLK